jgi:DNA polymerase-3 subunit beta
VKIVISRKSLEDALMAVGHAINKNSPKVSLQCVFMRATDGVVEFVGTNNEILIRKRVAAKADDGVMLIPHERFAAAIKSTKSDSDVTIQYEPEDGKLKVQCGKAKWSFATEDPHTFPDAWSEVEGQAWVNASEYRAAIKRTSYAADPGSTTYALSAIAHIFQGEILTCLGTDGRRLSLQKLKLAKGEVPTFAPVMVPASTLKIVERISAGLGETDMISIGTSPNRVAFRFGDVELVTALTQGRFPRWEDAIPDDQPVGTFIVETDAFKAALDASAVTASHDSSGVDMDADETVMVGNRSETGNSVVEVDLVSRQIDTATTVTFDPCIMRDVLGSMPGKQIEVQLRGPKGHIKLVTDDGFLGVVCPLTRDI